MFYYDVSAIMKLFLCYLVDNFWVFTEFDRSGFVGAVVLSFLILLYRYGI